MAWIQKKQVYANAFTIYALCKYYKASGLKIARTQAVELYRLLKRKSYDNKKTGYLEAFSRTWGPISDLRLSSKDNNEIKTMNTHLHVLEAYTSLYRIWQDPALKMQILQLTDNFFDYFIDKNTHHLSLFFDENWNRKSSTVSYGHDIESSWLLLEAVQVVGDPDRIARVKRLCLQIADVTCKGLDTEGGLWYEFEPGTENIIKEKHWWVQAEAMIGFFNAWQISGDQKYLERSIGSWEFVKSRILDLKDGEWYWGVDEQGGIMKGDKVGIWKCPYHNSRACLEIMGRISGIYPDC